MKFTFATLFFFVSVALAAPQPAEFNKLRRATTNRVKSGSYIIKLKDGVSKDVSIQSLNDLFIAADESESYKEVTYGNWTIINGYAAKLGSAALRAVLADPNVEYVEEDGIAHINYK
jgi:cerevisin